MTSLHTISCIPPTALSSNRNIKEISFYLEVNEKAYLKDINDGFCATKKRRQNIKKNLLN